MSSPDSCSSQLSSDPAVPEPSWAYALVLRLHFYIGLMVGPFIFVAALTGGLYVISPQIENLLYRDQLKSGTVGDPLPLAIQIRAARSLVGDSATLVAVRPAPEAGATSRIMFADSKLAEFQHRAIFVDPVNAEILGDSAVYGTSGALPFRTWTDLLHRSLHLGAIGRYYSELAASWLWLVALGGVFIWISQRRRGRQHRQLVSNSSSNRPVSPSIGRSSVLSSSNGNPVKGTVPSRGLGPGNRNRARLGRWHSTIGLVLLVVLLFFSVTGLTWSKWAGGNISVLRASLGWGTPSVNTALADLPPQPGGAHNHHDHVVPAATVPAGDLQRDAALFDAVLESARSVGIDAGLVEIKPASEPGRAWTVTEIDRRWPTQVDAAAIDPNNLKVVDQTDFSEFPVAAKLTRWGIDAHMGVLFGWPNQVVLFLFAMALCCLVVLGYVMWWRRRPTRVRPSGHPGVLGAFLRMPMAARSAVVIMAGLLGWLLPVMGGTLVLFVLLDVLLGRMKARAG
ncbi:MAG: hypothetical protein CL583_12800 [Alteromonadaceae bacterium]|nr:hypothetical protein [Alteromonadaceae bacterium]